MQIAVEQAKVLAEVRVLELIMIGKDGGPRILPMAGAWLPDEGHILITTPLAYSQKAFDLRRDGRVALLFSDFTGSGLDGSPSLLVQGTATAPDRVVTPAEIPAYWAELFRRNPGLADETRDEAVRATMSWYYLRLPLYVSPDRLITQVRLPVGGRHEPYPDESASLPGRVSDAVDRYPSVILASRDLEGHPTGTRATITRSTDGDELQLQTPDAFAGTNGKAALLWHRHDGHAGEMISLQVTGDLTGAGREWSFRPGRIPGALTGGHDTGSWQDWIEDGRARTQQYLDRRGFSPDPIDWRALADLAR
ncbi:pyridoxamine 5'-phosphate oxidase family protein [Microlunatus sp. GCM10028923]|uniref:pyridoxamine 5'-phosphate oxidase family protein n=1 Tax=Microlunatus sp. GCM10028923 TaxID=3273400 RepID=UPI00361C17E2